MIYDSLTAMPNVDPLKVLSFASSVELNEWLKVYHAVESELWIRMFKKNSGIPSLSWNDVVIESLCWGWIDGIRKSLDEQAYLQRITPRKPRSCWSKRNTEHVERLISEGRMMEPGMKQVEAAKADGRWDNAYPPASESKVPTHFLAALKDEPKAEAFFLTLNKSSMHAISYGLTSAKKPETRHRRFDKFIKMLINEENP